MKRTHFTTRRTRTPIQWASVCAAVLGLVSGCGGDTINNEGGVGGQKLSFAFFQRCINPIFLEQLPIVGTGLSNTCAGSGCHDNSTGTGGAFRIIPSAAVVTLPAAPDSIRASDMYKNFYSSQGEVVLSAIAQSRLLAKPRVQGVLHGGGLIFETDTDPKVRLIQFWMTHPAPTGQDEFATDPGNGTCTIS